MLSPEGPVGQGDLKVMFDAVALMLTSVVPTILLTLACQFARHLTSRSTLGEYRPHP